MLSCPYCQKPVLEDSPSCPSCSLSIEGATALLGPVPLLNRGLTDTTEVLSPRQRKLVKREINHFERQFPGSHLNLVLRDFDPAYNISTHLFWLFNTAGLSSQESQNEANKDVLIGLDPKQGRLGLMVGYGLEPYVPSAAVTALLVLALPLLEEGKNAEALRLLIRKLSVLLRNASLAARQTLGLIDGD